MKEKMAVELWPRSVTPDASSVPLSCLVTTTSPVHELSVRAVRHVILKKCVHEKYISDKHIYALTVSLLINLGVSIRT